MAKKKSKRPNLSQETLERARAEMRGEPVQVAEAVPVEMGQAPAAPKPKVKKTGIGLATRHIPTLDELLNEYAYVLVDLRNMLILAVVLFAVIIVAAIVLPRIS